MKPVMQTVMGNNGNCYSACLASILEISIDEVPNFTEADDFWTAVRTWLRERGWGVIGAAFNDIFTPDDLDGYQIVCGESPRGLKHATVWLNGKMVHDPHPDRNGIYEAESADILYPLDASVFKKVENELQLILGKGE